MTRFALLTLTLTLSGCMGGPPRNPERAQRARYSAYDDDGAYAASSATSARSEDRWSVEAMLPRSGDPQHPNVKVDLSVMDVRSHDALWVSAGVRGSIVRGVINLRAAFSAGSERGRHKSQATSFIVVQAGREGMIQFTQEARFSVGTYQGLRVLVHRASPEGVDLELAPYVSPTTVRGEHVSGATRVTLAPGQGVVIGGFTQSRQSEHSGLGHRSGSSSQRETLVVLSVDVLG